jgi:hypothetical protein
MGRGEKMNTDTGQIKGWDSLTEEEKKSGKWFPISPDTTGREIRELSKSEIKRRQYMDRVAEKTKNGENF